MASAAVHYPRKSKVSDAEVIEVHWRTGYGNKHFNPFTLRVPLENIVCHFHAFEKFLGNKIKVHRITEGELLFDFWHWLTVTGSSSQQSIHSHCEAKSRPGASDSPRLGEIWGWPSCLLFLVCSLNGPLALLNMWKMILPFGEDLQHGHPGPEGMNFCLLCFNWY